MEEKIKLLTSQLGENRVKRNVDFKEYFSIVQEGVVEALYIATTTRELIKSVELCRELKLDSWVFGSGTKIIIPQGGFQGLVIKNRSDNLRVFGIKGKVSREGIGIEEAFLEADSGSSLGRLDEFASQQGLGGLEVIKSIPGTLGGSFYTNADLQRKASQVKVLTSVGNQEAKEVSEVSREDIILSVVFKLRAKK